MYTACHVYTCTAACRVLWCFTPWLLVLTESPDGVCTVDREVVDVDGNTATYSFCGVGFDIDSFICKLDGRILPDCMSNMHVYNILFLNERCVSSYFLEVTIHQPHRQRHTCMCQSRFKSIDRPFVWDSQAENRASRMLSKQGENNSL